MSSWVSSANRTATWLPWMLVILGPVLLFGPALAAGQVLYWGTAVLQFVPWHAFAAQSVLAGELPLWNPLVGMGAPLLANYQSGLLYPPNWSMLLVEPAVAQTWLTMLHLIFAGAGMVLLGRRLGIGAIGQCVAGLGFALSGYLVARSSFQSINNSVAWLPWLLWAAEGLVGRVVDGRELASIGRAALTLAAVLSAQWLAGHAQTAWYSLLLTLAWVGWRGWGARRSVRARESSGMLALGLALAFCVAAVQLVPTLEYLGISPRSASVDWEAGLTYSLWPWRLLGWMAPGLFGHPSFGGFWGYANYWEDALYVGTLAFVLAALESAKALLGRSPSKDTSRFLMSVVLVSLLFALGKNTPLYPLLFRNVPTFDMFQAPTRWSLLAVFAMCLLAGFGANSWSAPRGRALYWTRLGTAGAAGMIVFAFLAAALVKGLEPSLVRSFALAGLALAIVGALTLTLPPRPRPLWFAALGLFLLTDLLLATVGLNPTTSAAAYRGESSLASLGTGHRIYMPAALEQELKFNQFFRFDRFDADFQLWAVRSSGLPNTPMLDGLASANNFDPLIPERYAEWIDRLERADSVEQRRLLAFMDVAWVAEASDLATVPEYRPLAGPARVRLVPRAVAVCSMQAAFDQVFSHSFDPEAVVIVEAEGCPQELPTGGPGTAEIAAQGGNWIELIARADSGGWVVLSDLHYPGWRAQVDGEDSDILPANGAFRAIHVPPGTHTLRLEYQPTWLAWSAALSVGGLLTLLALVWLWRKR